MSGDGDAKVKVGADISAAKRAAAELKGAFKGAGEGIQSAISGAANAIIGDLTHVATAAGRVSFASQHQQVRDFEAATARMASSSTQDLAQLRNETEATGIAIGKRPKEVNEWAHSVGQLTHSFQGANKQVEGFAGLAARTGKHINDYRGLAVELSNIGKVGGDSAHALGVLETQADSLGVVGGISAFATQVEGLSDTISHFSIKSEADFLKVTAAAAALGKGLNPQAAGRVQQQALGYLTGNSWKIERYLGHSITDKQGQVENPAAVLEEISKKVVKQYGKERGRLNLQAMFGQEAGAALVNADWDAAKKGATAGASPEQKKALERYKNTDAGKRDVADAKLAESSRALMGSSTKLGQAADALQKFSASNPITGTAGSMVAGGLVTGVGGSIVKAIVGTKAGGGAVGGSKMLGAALRWGGGALAAAGAGYAVGTGLDYVGSWSDRINGVNRDKHIFKGLSAKSIKEEADESDVDANAKLQARVKEIRAANAANAKERAAAEPAQPAQSLGAGGGDLLKLLASVQAINKASAMDESAADKIAAAITAAMQGGGVKVEVTNATETPIQATVKGAKSSSAGRQGGS